MMKKNLCSKSTLNFLLVTGVSIALCGQPALGRVQAAQTTSAATSPVTGKGDAAADKTRVAPSAAPQIDTQAIALLRRNQEAMFALRTYSVECRTKRTRANPKPGFVHIEYEVATLEAQKPNKMRYEQWYLKQDDKPVPDWTKPAQLPDTLFACDGVTRYQQYGNQHRVSKLVTSRYLGTLLEPWRGFFVPENTPLDNVERARKEGELRVVRLDGREDVGGVMCDKVYMEYGASYVGLSHNQQITWYFGPDGLTRRCVDGYALDKGGFTSDFTLVNLRVNAPVDQALFAYTPRPGSKLIDDNPQISLLANGSVAPDIRAQDRDNKPVKLLELRGKVVVIDFWASWCAPCNAAMPHNQAVIQKLQAEGLPVVLLAVDNADTRLAFDAWIKRQSKAYPAMQFVFVPASEPLSTQYRAAVIPTQYVLDKTGKVVAGFVGYNGPTEDLEKAVRVTLLAEAGKPLFPLP